MVFAVIQSIEFVRLGIVSRIGFIKSKFRIIPKTSGRKKNIKKREIELNYGFTSKNFSLTEFNKMTNPDDFDLNDLQRQIIQSIKGFSDIQKFQAADNEFIQKEINKISKQRENFRSFAKESITHSLDMSEFADDLLTFTEYCENDEVCDDELLELLRSLLNDARLYIHEQSQIIK
jgi:hypothetical protein